jgi:hypothetical protein
MQFIQKYITSISLVGLFTAIVSGYFILQSDTSSTSGEVKPSRESAIRVSQSGTGVEADTGKKLETVANSGTGWGMSPFGSGKPLEEGEKKLEFKKPNMEWKTRTLSGITYVFGEGNPKEVGLTEKEKETYKKCNFEEDKRVWSCGFIGNEVLGYVTPDVEKDLITLLSHPAWEKVLTECRSQFETNEYPTTQDDDTSYIRIMSPGWMDMEKMFWIDEQTGRKTITNQFNSIVGWFQNTITARSTVLGKEWGTRALPSHG